MQPPSFLFDEIYLISPYLYSVFGVCFLGIFSGLLSAFTITFSLLFDIKYRIVLFLPVFLLLNFSIYLPNRFWNYSVRWLDYMMLFCDEPKSTIFICLVFLALILFSIVGIVLGLRKDCLK